jgi:hypothetical protein
MEISTWMIQKWLDGEAPSTAKINDMGILWEKTQSLMRVDSGLDEMRNSMGEKWRQDGGGHRNGIARYSVPAGQLISFLSCNATK